MRQEKLSDAACWLALLAVCASPAFASPALAQPLPPALGESREAIITDEEFDARLPAIDPNPDAPLIPIADWEAEQQRLEEEAADQSETSPLPALQDGPLPALQDGDAVETLADPPVEDPEIEQPLVPLGEFDVEPFDESQYTEADSDTRSGTLRYGYRIEGLDALGTAPAPSDVGAIAANDIRQRFNPLSALEDGDGSAANGSIISARMREDQQLLLDILSSEGFFDATVNGTVELPATPGERLTVVLTAAPGRRYFLGAIQFDAPPVHPDDLITRNFVPKPGEPIIADRVLAAEANLAVRLPEAGYPFTEVGKRDILIDPATGTGDYTLPIITGARSSFGDIVTSGTTAFDAEHIALIARFEKGELYDSRKVDDLRQALVATGLFSAVAVKPVPGDAAAPDGTVYADLSVEQEAGPPRTIAAEAGYGTGQGFRLEGNWTHRNLFPPEGALIASAVAGTQEQGAAVIFRRSNAGRRDRTVELNLSALHSKFDAFEAFTGRLSGRISYDSTPIWQKRLTYSYGFELVATNEQDYNFTRGVLDRRTFYLFALPGQVTFDATKSLLDPTSGFRVSLKLSPEGSLGAEKQIYARGLVDATAYYPVGDSIVLAGRARIGSIAGSQRANIAPSRRYYAGGGGSVRGFGYQELGPKDIENRPIGGRSVIEGAAEVRYRFGNYGVVGFVDAGQVYTSSTPGFDNLRFGVGVGGRFYTNFGPLRLDVATPINRQPGESRFSLYISIGQAF